MLNCTLTTFAMLAIKIAFSYNFLFSKIYIINFFGKNIELVSIFGESFIIFKILFYVFFYIFYFIILFRCSEKIYFKKYNSIKNIQNNSFMMLFGREEGVECGIEKNGLYQNILITGSIGSGKTSTAITSALKYFIENNIPGLILDIKGNYYLKVKEMMLNIKNSLDIKIISLEEGKYNPVDLPYVSAYELANRIKKALLVLQDGKSLESYWLDKAEGYIKDFIVLIRAYNDYVSFKEIHMLVVNEEYLLEKIEEVKNKVITRKLSDVKIFEITNSISNIKNEYMNLDSRTKNILRSEITRITDIFVSDYNICAKFCSKNDEDILLNKNIFVVTIGIGGNMKLAKVIATYIKLNFQHEILNQKEPKDKFFLCDEYQEVCNEEDAHFFSLSREYKCINVVAMQSYTSLKNVLKDENTSNVIIQNFVNKIWFRNDDVYTVGEIIKQIGKEEKIRTNISISENGQDTKYSFFSNSFKNNKSGITENYIINKSMEEILDISYFTSKLKTFEAVCLFSNGIENKLYKKLTLDMWKVGKNSYEK